MWQAFTHVLLQIRKTFHLTPAEAEAKAVNDLNGLLATSKLTDDERNSMMSRDPKWYTLGCQALCIWRNKGLVKEVIKALLSKQNRRNAKKYFEACLMKYGSDVGDRFKRVYYATNRSPNESSLVGFVKCLVSSNREQHDWTRPREKKRVQVNSQRVKDAHVNDNYKRSVTLPPTSAKSDEVLDSPTPAPEVVMPTTEEHGDEEEELGWGHAEALAPQHSNYSLNAEMGEVELGRKQKAMNIANEMARKDLLEFCDGDQSSVGSRKLADADAPVADVSSASILAAGLVLTGLVVGLLFRRFTKQRRPAPVSQLDEIITVA